MLLFLKRYLPIIKTNNRIWVGIKEQFIDFPLSNELHQLLKQLIDQGLTKEEVFSSNEALEMYQKDMLTEDNAKQRKEMFLDYMGVTFPQEAFQKKIMILGAGGMGSNTAYLLAQFGFKNITLVDFDIVEQSDIEKMLIYRKEHVGLPKIKALKQIVESQFPYCRVVVKEKKIESARHLEELFHDANISLVVKAMDPKEIIFKSWLNKICFEQNIPYIHASYSFEQVCVGPLYVPGVTSCDNCFSMWQKEGLGEEYVSNTMEKLFHEYTVHPSISFNINIAANLSLKDIIFFMAGRFDYVSSLGKLIDYDITRLNGKSHEIPKHPQCNVCGTPKTVDL